MKYQFKVDSKDFKDYLPYLRLLLHHSEQRVAPLKIEYSQKIQELINGQHFAHRLGLICFKRKDDALESLKDYQYQIKNQGETSRWFTSAQLQNEELKPISMDEHVLQIPPKTELRFKLYFTQGKGSENARFSRIQGFGADPKENKITFESTDVDLSDILERTKKWV